MSFKIDQPNILGKSEAEQLQQVKNYLFQLAGQLNWALNTLESGTSSGKIQYVNQNGQTSSQPPTEQTPQATFNSIKALIIKSADIVQAYYDEVVKKFEESYFAESDFGTYISETNAKITANSTSITTNYENFQKIIDGVNEDVSNIKAHIKSGLLYYDKVTGDAVHGVEIGEEKIDEDGKTVMNRCARFLANKLEFFDQGNQDSPVAYISNFKLYITHAEITGTLKLGRFVFDTTNGLTIKWI